MTNNHGGKREGAGSGGRREGAGRPKTTYKFSRSRWYVLNGKYVKFEKIDDDRILLRDDEGDIIVFCPAGWDKPA